MFLHDGERGACRIRNAERCGKRPGEGRFPRAEAAEECEERPREKGPRDARAKRFHSGKREGERGKDAGALTLRVQSGIQA